MGLFRRVTTIQDVVAWDLCCGCGACAAACPHGALKLVNVPEAGIRPVADAGACERCGTCLAVCPGYSVDSRLVDRGDPARLPPPNLLGPTLEVWEGHATDPEIRHRASSGGALTALALYCLEREGASFVLHTGMNPRAPWENETVRSRTREDLLRCAGSRYAPAAPCGELRRAADAGGPFVFIGKPCDATGAALLRRQVPELDRRLALVLTFFCAGTPSTRGTLDALERSGVDRAATISVAYRGDGWPGRFRVRGPDGALRSLRTYEEAWGDLQKYRPLRCHLCPDGVGEIADISCGDAWHRYAGETDGGLSAVLVRTPRGRDILERARAAGYVTLEPSTPELVIGGQGLVKRRQELFGRYLAFRFVGAPVPRCRGFRLLRSFAGASLRRTLVTVFGTLRRILQRGWYRRRAAPRHAPP